MKNIIPTIFFLVLFPLLSVGQWSEINRIHIENQKIIMVDSLEGYIGTTNGIYQTFDGWKTFKNILFDFHVRSFDISPDGSIACSGVDLTKKEMGYRVSNNYGKTWKKQSNPHRFLHGHQEIRFFGIDSILASEHVHQSSFSIDGGNTWNKEFLDSSFSTVSDLAIIDKSQFLLSVSTATYKDSKEKTFKSIDGGKTWAEKQQYDDFGVLDFEIISSTIYGVGAYGLITKSFDKGETWNTLPKINDYHLVKLDFIDDKYGFVAGGMSSLYPLYGVIYRTKDGGNSWDNVSPEGIKTTISGIDMLNENLGYAVDNDGIIYKTTNGGGPAKSDSVPKFGKDGKLWTGESGGNSNDSTNTKDTTINGLNAINENVDLEIFPNPTQDKVTIRIVSKEDNPKPIQLSLKDGLGKTVLEETMSSETKTINLSRYSKGVYYLQLNAEDWQTVRKVVKE